MKRKKRNRKEANVNEEQEGKDKMERCRIDRKGK